MKPDRGQSTAVKWVWPCVNLSLDRKKGGKVGRLLVVDLKVEELEEFIASPFSLPRHFILNPLIYPHLYFYPVKHFNLLVKF